MPLTIKKTTSNIAPPKVNMLVYGQPGVGKTTLAASDDNVLIIDVENGARFLGMHGKEADFVSIEAWSDMREVPDLVKNGKYTTVVIDPLGELFDKLIAHLKKSGYGANGGDTLSIAGWGVAKDKFRALIRTFRDLDVNLVLVAHIAEEKSEDQVYIRPKLPAKMDVETCAMMDAVGYLCMERVDKGLVRRVHFSPSDRFFAKDRMNTLPPHMDNATFKEVRECLTTNEWFKKRKAQEKREEEFVKSLDDNKS